MVDMFNKEVKKGNLIIAHNIKTPHQLYLDELSYALVTGENECFTVRNDTKNRGKDYCYFYNFDSCILIDKPVKKELYIWYKLKSQYINYYKARKR